MALTLALFFAAIGIATLFAAKWQLRGKSRTQAIFIGSNFAAFCCGILFGNLLR